MSEEILKNALKATTECLGEERLLALESAEDKQHLADCPRCQAERKLLDQFFSSETSPEEQKQVDWIAKQLAKNPVAKPTGWRSWFTLPRLSAISLAMASVLVFISLRTTMNTAPSIDDTTTNLSNFRSGEVKLNTPTGNIATAPKAFTWEEVKGAARYRVSLMEVDQNVLWSMEINTISMEVPEEVQVKMVPAKTLLWQVDALDASGMVIASSPAERFRVTP